MKNNNNSHANARAERLYGQPEEYSDDQRDAFQIDRDRILYCSAFHRLAGITQIVRAGELDIFHTRQQHTYKVAQIGRRLAEFRIRQQPDLAEHLGLNAEVVDAASLAHDLGHPPFGHAAESLLDDLVKHPEKAGGTPADKAGDGFEGNAQTFRILTKLSVRTGKERPGLDLSRAVLAATLKYPWLRDETVPKKKSKWSAYITEKKQFEWARQGANGDFKTAEAELMDWADDISYSVHDLEDFHRVGVIPWQEILSKSKQPDIVSDVVTYWSKDPAVPENASHRIEQALERILRKVRIFPSVINEPYSGSREQRRQLRNFSSQLIGDYVRAIELNGDPQRPAVIINPTAEDEVRLLKYFARRYVIGLPSLNAQQYGQKKIIKDLFQIILREGKTNNYKIFPARFRYIWDDNSEAPPARLTADCIASLTENEAYQLHSRLTGITSGLVLDPIVR